MEFRWNRWNVEHIGRHGIGPEEAEDVVLAETTDYLLYRGDGKWLVWGQTDAGRLIQVVYVLDDDDTAFVIHARALTEREKGRYKRRGRE